MNLKYATAAVARSNVDILRALTGGPFTYKGREYDMYVTMRQSKERRIRNKFLLQAAEILRDPTKDDEAVLLCLLAQRLGGSCRPEAGEVLRGDGEHHLRRGLVGRGHLLEWGCGHRG